MTTMTTAEALAAIDRVEATINELRTRCATLVSERDKLKARVTELEAIPEEIAKGWDGCYYDDDMPRWSIGDRIRHDANRLIDAARAEARNG